MKLFGPGLCFSVSSDGRLLQPPVSPLKYRSKGQIIYTKTRAIVSATVIFSLDCMQAAGQWCGVSRLKSCSALQKLYCSAPCTIDLKGRADKKKRKKFYILHLILNLIVSLHNYDMRGKPVCLYCD